MAKRISEADEDANAKADKKAKGTNSGKPARVTGQLLQALLAADKACANLATEFGRVAADSAKKLKMAFRQAKTPTPQEVQAVVDSYKRCLVVNDRIAYLATEVETWGHCISGAIAAFLEVAAAERVTERKLRDKAKKHMRRICREFSASVADALLPCLYDKAGIIINFAAPPPGIVPEEDSESSYVGDNMTPLANDFPTSGDDEATWGARSAQDPPGK